MSKKSFSPRVEQEYTVGPAGFRVLCPRKPGAILETGSLHPPPAALRLFPFLGFSAHTFYPQGVCGIRRAAQPLTAALPYRHGKFTTSIDSHTPACVYTQAGVNVWSAQKFFQIGLHGNGEPGQIVESLGQIGTLGRGHQGHRKQFVHKGFGIRVRAAEGIGEAGDAAQLPGDPVMPPSLPKLWRR